jgi:hypothetical protein
MSSPPNPPSTATPKQAHNQQAEGPTALQLGIAVLILGTSAGFTLYTKKADSMLRRMNQVTENQLRRNPPKFGPPTKEQWERLRPRIDKDEFF